MKHKLVSTLLINLSQLGVALMLTAQLASIFDGIHRRRRHEIVSLLNSCSRIKKSTRSNQEIADFQKLVNLLFFLSFRWLMKLRVASPTFLIILTGSLSSCSESESFWAGFTVEEPVAESLGEELNGFGIAEISSELSKQSGIELLSIPPAKLSTAGEPAHISIHSLYKAETTRPPPLLLPESTALR